MNEMITNLGTADFFSGIAPDDIEQMLVCLHARIAEYGKDELVIWEGSTVNEIGIVLSGHGRTIKNNPSGKISIVTLLEKGSYIGVLLAASKERRSPVSVQALDHLTVLFFSVKNVLERCKKACPRHDRLLNNFMNGIAEKALVLHDRNDCLVEPTVREKIRTYLSKVSKAQGTRIFTIPLDRNAMAEYLNVERSALSRELSRMKKDGIIDYYKSDFRLL